MTRCLFKCGCHKSSASLNRHSGIDIYPPKRVIYRHKCLIIICSSCSTCIVSALAQPQRAHLGCVYARNVCISGLPCGPAMVPKRILYNSYI